jgi:hypothetical protein
VGSSIDDDGVLHLQPRLLDRLDGVGLCMRFRGNSLRLSVKGDELTVLVQAEGFRGPLRVCISGDLRELTPGRAYVFQVPGQASSAYPRPSGDGR